MRALRKTAWAASLSVSLLAVAACTTAPAPPPPPVVVIAPPPPPILPPARPLPPGGAILSLTVPPFGIDGIRQTPNRNLSSNESVWHLRAALNVAALNCQGPVWNQIATNYNLFIGNNKQTLTKISRAIDGEYKLRFPGENALRVRDSRMTDLYNYFSLPTVKQEYCDTALLKSQEAVATDWRALPQYSPAALTEIDAIFIRFFDSYARYQYDLENWNRLYAPPPAPPAAPSPAAVPLAPAVPVTNGG